ncbi:MAG: hypothetical protein L0H55_17030 [Candidatus Nitrosocosmicus sp.]|nr:hypothetical protein [Candidatus Nitrosocosmicus sp.]
MSRNKGDKDYTDSEKSMLKSMIKDFEVCKMSDHQMMEVLSRKVGRRIKESFFYRMKKEANTEDKKLTAQDWLDNFVRFGIADFYKERVEETLLVQKGLLGLYADEASKKDIVSKQNRVLLAKLAKAISDNSKNLAEIGIGSPIILAKLQSLIPKELLQGDLEYTEKYFQDMDRNKKMLWSGESDEGECNKNNDVEKTKLDPSKAPTALLPPIDNLETINKNKQSLNYGLSSEDEDEQRVF